MSFQLFGFDIIPMDRLYGFWICEVKNWHNETNRSLLGVYHAEGEWFIDVLFVKFII